MRRVELFPRSPLADKLATLGKRGANQRVEKAVYWLAEARAAG